MPPDRREERQETGAGFSAGDQSDQTPLFFPRELARIPAAPSSIVVQICQLRPLQLLEITWRKGRKDGGCQPSSCQPRPPLPPWDNPLNPNVPSSQLGPGGSVL